MQLLSLKKPNVTRCLLLAERASLAGVLAGTIAGVVLQQPGYASIPVASTLTLNQVNRQRRRGKDVKEIHHLQQGLNGLTIEQIPALEGQMAKLQEQFQELQQTTRSTTQTPVAVNTVVAESLPSDVKSDTLPAEIERSDAAQETRVILIDGANLHITATELEHQLDYTRLFACLAAEAQNCRILFYTGEARNSAAQQGFFGWLHRHGVQLVTKPIVNYPDGRSKANLDVELSLDMYELSRTCNTIVLVSGDGDFACTVRAARNRGARVEVASFRSHTSKTLIQVADAYLDLATITDAICRNMPPQPASPKLVTLRPRPILRQSHQVSGLPQTQPLS
jgi:uncharacterized LabA/DUF88 family protein